jgi:cytochrome c553
VPVLVIAGSRPGFWTPASTGELSAECPPASKRAKVRNRGGWVPAAQRAHPLIRAHSGDDITGPLHPRQRAPCAMCHGPDAKGQGAAPRLAGQLHDYVAKTLLNWSRERCRDRAHAGPSLIMEPIATNLTEPQVAALAAYLNNLE